MQYTNETTVPEVLNAWDAGESIWSVEMGGMGPGYEQAIQNLIVEILRDMHEQPLPDEHTWQNWAEPTIQRVAWGAGYSGAQVGAAKSAALMFLKQGYGMGMGMAPLDRRIQVSKQLPVSA